MTTSYATACPALSPLFLALVCSTAPAQPGPQMNLPRVELTIGMHRIDAQVAASDAARQTGLMFRQDMPAQELQKCY